MDVVLCYGSVGCFGVADGFAEGQFVVDHVAGDLEFGGLLVELAGLVWFSAMEGCLDSVQGLFARCRLAGTIGVGAGIVSVVSGLECDVGQDTHHIIFATEIYFEVRVLFLMYALNKAVEKYQKVSC